jgi:hypothetical protein
MLYYVYNHDIPVTGWKEVTAMFKGSGGFTGVTFQGQSRMAINTAKQITTEMFRAPFSVDTQSSTTNEHWFGFSVGTNFQTESSHLYLAVCDVRNARASLDACSFAGALPTGFPSVVQSAFSNTANQTNYTRIYRTFAGTSDNNNNGRFFVDTYPMGNGSVIQIDVKNWRQFDVTGMLPPDIETLAHQEYYDEVYLTLPDPFHGETNMTPEKFVAMGGIIRNDAVDGYMAIHEIPLNYIILN